ncbi:MAG: antitoxin MazE5 [bacterium]|nr:antitoxin MazE5 [bacterium]
MPDLNDASLLDRALAALCADLHAAEIDRSYGIYETLPLETEDEWGNPAAFLDAVGST